MVESFYEEIVDIPDDPSLDYKWSPAEVNQILFRNFGDPLQAVGELVALTRDDMYGFVENGLEESEVTNLIQNGSSTSTSTA
jgi:hypothetical protein